MSSPTFYTRSPMLADLRRLVVENANGEYRFEGFRQLFEAVDAYCAEQFPQEDRGGWFSPRIVGGAQINHTPPHVVFGVFAIYLHLAHGDADPLPFLAGPLNLSGITAISLPPTDRHRVAGRDGQGHPMTDLLFIAPALTPESWTLDTYGLPGLREGVLVIGWHAAAQPHAEALSSGQLLLHRTSGRVLDPLSLFTEEEEGLFFQEPLNRSRLERHRERLVEVFGTPLEVLGRNSEAALRVLEAYLAR